MLVVDQPIARQDIIALQMQKNRAHSAKEGRGASMPISLARHAMIASQVLTLLSGVQRIHPVFAQSVLLEATVLNITFKTVIHAWATHKAVLGQRSAQLV